MLEIRLKNVITDNFLFWDNETTGIYFFFYFCVCFFVCFCVCFPVEINIQLDPT